MTSSSKANGPLLVPPSNFAMVEDGVYRSAYPTEENVLYLRHIGVTHLVLLSIEQLPGPVKRLLGSEVTGKTASNCLTRGPIRIINIVDMRTWRVDGVNSGDDFSPRDVTRALDFAVDRRWHPVLFACPLGELQTNVLIGCMRRYQHWALSAIFSECELYTSVCRTLRQSILLFIESWDPANHPLSAVNIQYRNRKMAQRERLRAHQERRKHRHAAAFDDDRDRTSGSNSFEDSAGEMEPEVPLSVMSDLLDKNSADGQHSSTVSSTVWTFSEMSVRSTSPPMKVKAPNPDAAFISTSGQRPPMMMRRAAAAAAAARLREQQDQHPHKKASASEADEQAGFVQMEEGKVAGVIWAEWYLEALRTAEELKARTYSSPCMPYSGADVCFGAELPPPHVLYAGARNPPALDARSTFTKESIVEEDDD
ncbi:conserved hypothetical protein [Leishmania infantum JPCM5]|uniref:Tyrosine_phosphatase_family_-_putative n=2 Tax=Leishmania infantum TaxID=5671 RepID=A0A6L0XLE6_LEIIN|nr:conserved hypothetical protein [Leishmania infantum JPCM5]CAC9524063.1 Tyrosine_phosphatase_family_-_putative [Leishmania infantum]CAM70854.1 conserved hypothetical protein [Leishmania infantum JPCM5]SUZ44672.1 Tyrosine_phosphatase_family_-_putative [Leishmania infantum]|eukprot:XP_001467787.1 conserved hypothetical protein [Leishmania infantum JPCM5]